MDISDFVRRRSTAETGLVYGYWRLEEGASEHAVIMPCHLSDPRCAIVQTMGIESAQFHRPWELERLGTSDLHPEEFAFAQAEWGRVVEDEEAHALPARAVGDRALLMPLTHHELLRLYAWRQLWGLKEATGS